MTGKRTKELEARRHDKRKSKGATQIQQVDDHSTVVMSQVYEKTDKHTSNTVSKDGGNFKMAIKLTESG